MKIGDFVQWKPTVFVGVDIPPMQGFVVAVDGDWVVVRFHKVQAPAAPFATIHRNELMVQTQQELVRRGATLLT